jgi:hypothetical protein
MFDEVVHDWIHSEDTPEERSFRVKKALDDNNITLEEKAGRIEISGYSCMHNSYNDMPKMLQDIYFKLKENCDIISFKRDEGCY